MFFFFYNFFRSCQLSVPGHRSIFEPFRTQKCTSAGLICLAHKRGMGGCGKGKEQSFALQSSAGGRCLQLVLGLPLALAPRVPAALLVCRSPRPAQHLIQ